MSRLKNHIKKGNPVYGGAVNNKRKKYAKELHRKVALDKHGNPVYQQDPYTGEMCYKNLSNTQLSYRSGYVDGVSESTAAAKTKSKLPTNRAAKARDFKI